MMPVPAPCPASARGKSSSATHRVYCRDHALRRSRQRGVCLGLCEFERLERDLGLMRPAFERPGRSRYNIRVKHPRGWIGAIYDTELGCVVTVWPIRRGRRRGR